MSDWQAAKSELGEIARLQAENERLRAALVVAKEDIQSWGAYADTYFQEKWDLAGDIAAIDEALRVSDGSREAGETVGLDPKDDSAVSEAETPPSLSPKEQKGD